MLSMLSIRFIYRECYYDALIRLKETFLKKEYYITIMNGELENKIFGNHTILEEDGEIIVNAENIDNEVFELKAAIAEALSKYLALKFRI